MRLLHCLLIGAAAAAAALAPAAVAAQRDVLHGRVVGEDSVALRGAHVSVRSARTLHLRETYTDGDGRWRVAFSDTSAAYELSVRSAGVRPVQIRLQRGADGRFGEAVVVLPTSAITLPALTVRGGRRPGVTRPSGGTTLPQERGAQQRWERGDETRGDRGDLNALGALADGATLLPDDEGHSVGGLPPGQNRVVLNGLPFGGDALPRLSVGDAYSTTATPSAARGGFTGGAVAASLNNIPLTPPELKLQVNLADPGLQWGGRRGSGAGDPWATRAAVAHFRSDVGRSRMANIQAAADYEARTRPLSTLLTLQPDALRALGVAPDSAARLRAIADRAGIPLTAGALPEAETHTTLRTLFAADLNRIFLDTEGGAHLSLNRRTASPVGIGGGYALPSTAGERTSSSMDAGVRLERGGAYLHRLGVSHHRSRTDAAPYLELPAARVTVRSELAEAEGGVATLRFGGYSGTASLQRRRRWDALYSLDWMSMNEAVRWTVGAEAGAYAARQEGAANRSGTFAYRSLAELEAGRPFEFTRSVAERPGTGQVENAAAYLQNAISAGPNLEIRTGLRLEASRAGRGSGFNPDVLERFGARTDRVPGDVQLLPRVGATWSSPPGRTRDRAPYGTLSGGAGLYRAAPEPEEFALHSVLDGLGPASVRLRCTGPQTPETDWAAWAADPSRIPTACRDGGGELAAGVPDVVAYDAGYRAPRSFKANLAWSGTVPLVADRRLGVSLNGAYTRGIAQTTLLDLNFRGDPRFTLADEGGRPVFVPAAALDPASGTAPLAASRRHAEYAQVGTLRSDGAVETHQVTVRVSPARRNYYVFRYELGYTHSRSRQRARGFPGGFGGGVAAGDPADLTWAPNAYQAAHVIQGWVDAPLLRTRESPRLLTLRLIPRLQSGLPFTPLVLGDVNGDGHAFNDAAFIFDPATADPDVADGMRSVLANADAPVRRCLERQQGRVAQVNSCTGAWTANLDAFLQIVVARPPLGRSIYLEARALNLAAAGDRLLHGAAGTRGWGGGGAGDPVLLSVSGFDPDAGRFRYEVNERFGSARAARRANQAPFRVQLTGWVMLGKSYRRVQIEGVPRDLRDFAASAADSTRTLRSVVVPNNPIRSILTSPRLVLTAEQVDTLVRWEADLDAALDSIVAEVLPRVAPLLGRARVGEIRRLADPAREAGEDLTTGYKRCLKRLLSRDQWLSLGSNFTVDVDLWPPTPEELAVRCSGSPDD